MCLVIFFITATVFHLHAFFFFVVDETDLQMGTLHFWDAHIFVIVFQEFSSHWRDGDLAFFGWIRIFVLLSASNDLAYPCWVRRGLDMRYYKWLNSFYLPAELRGIRRVADWKDVLQLFVHLLFLFVCTMSHSLLNIIEQVLKLRPVTALIIFVFNSFLEKKRRLSLW